MNEGFGAGKASMLFVLVILTTAFLRQRYSDTDVVARSDVIVQASANPETLSFVPKQDARAAAWGHTLQLHVDEVLKGELKTNVISVSIDMGLNPMIGAYSSNLFGVVHDFRTPGYPVGMLQVFDTGSSRRPSQAVSGDLRTNHLWLLRRSTGASSKSNTVEAAFFVRDPEDIQSVSNKNRLLSIIK